MAERPDLEFAIPLLRAELGGAEILGVSIPKPVVLRQAVPGALESLLVGRRFETLERRAHFIKFALSGDAPTLELIVAPMLAGRFRVAGAGEKAPSDTAVSFELDGDRVLYYRDDVQMGKVYIIEAGAYEQVPGFESVGIDVLDADLFTAEAFAELARGRRDQVRVFLMDKRAIDSLGNAYADEVLFAAGIHPKTWVRSLSAEDLEGLRRAIVRVLEEAGREIAAAAPETDVKLRSFLKVRNRRGQPCPTCGTKLRRTGVRGYDSHFCPTCQPETRKTSIVDWRKLS